MHLPMRYTICISLFYPYLFLIYISPVKCGAAPRRLMAAGRGRTIMLYQWFMGRNGWLRLKMSYGMIDMISHYIDSWRRCGCTGFPVLQPAVSTKPDRI